MTLYLSYNINLKSNIPLIQLWSNTEIPILAVVSDNRTITFFQDEGQQMSEHSSQRDLQITSICWHPTLLVMVYGYENGKMGVWSDFDNKYKDEDLCKHDSKVINIKFNLIGQRVVSFDEKNTIIVWKFDKLTLQKMCQYQQKFEIHEIFFANFDRSKYKE